MKKVAKSKTPTLALRIVQKHHPNVTKVVDASDHITVTVTPKDSKESATRDHAHCAMAVACQRQQHADGAIVSVKSAYIIRGDTAYRYQVPTATAREVVSFDRAGAGGFASGQYQLRAPSKSARLGHWYLGPKKKPGRPHGNRVRHVTQNIRTSLLSKT